MGTVYKPVYFVKDKNGSYGRLGYVSDISDNKITFAPDLAPYYNYSITATEEINMEITTKCEDTIKTFLNDIVRNSIKKVIFNPPATIIIWANGEKTVSKCGPNDDWDPEKGFAIAMLKHYVGKSNLGWFMRKYVEPQVEKEENASLANIPQTLAEIGERLRQWAGVYNVGEYDDKTWEEAANAKEEENEHD